MVAELLAGMIKVLLYFGVAALVATAVVFAYTRCVPSTVLAVACSLVAVLWQLGLVAALGFELDPFSILVPFLVFAIGVSHGAQKMNGIMQDVGRGTDLLVAARYTFRRLFLAGLTALLADAVGFGVLMTIDIPIIRDLAMTASIGVAVLIFTNLLLLPVLLSYVGVSASAARRCGCEDIDAETGRGVGRLWRTLERFTEPRWAGVTVALALRANARYNRDNAYITANYSLSSDQFAVMVKTAPEGCLKFETLVEADRLAWALQQVPGVQTTVSLADAVRQVTAGTSEGSLKWLTLSRNQDVLNYGAQQASVNHPDLFDRSCSLMPVIAYLSDHKAATLERVVQAAEAFAREHGTPARQFLLAAGSAGIEAVTNIVVRDANHKMLLYVYGAVIVLCFITFRSRRAVLVAALSHLLLKKVR
jgi:predicted RND superfamily exporter protein